MHKALIWFLITYFLFVIYGSLVPLDYKPFPLDKALANFQNIAYLKLGIESRADWIANILLYIPLSFLALGSFRKYLKYGALTKVIFTLLVLLFCLATAIGVEFIQQFFPPRTVSLNDLIAETLGTLIGIFIWFGVGEKSLGYFAQLSQGSWLSAKSAIFLFLPSYVFLSLFPFDFVTSTGELNNKLASGHDTFFIDFSGCAEDLFRCILKWSIEIAVLMPLGALFAALRYVPNRKSLAVVVGFLLGVFIELMQIFIYSGSAQGFSVLTRMLGMAAGVKAYGFFAQRDLQTLTPWIGRAIGLVLIPYIITVLAINGWMAGHWITLQAAQQKLAETNFLPFYYFYFTTETVALVSFLSNVGAYLPVGFLFWLHSLRPSAGHKPSVIWVGLAAGVFATIVEAGKLFLPDKHVDPTDILLAMLAAGGAYAVLNKITQTGSQTHHAVLPLNNHALQREGHTDFVRDHSSALEKQLLKEKWFLPAGLIAICIAYAVYRYPIMPVWLGICIAGYCVALLRKPALGFLVIPALLPVLDFAPWTGRFFFDEFDLLILSTWMVLMVVPMAKPAIRVRLFDVLIIGFFVLCVLTSLLIGLMPLAQLDANAFSNYYSNYNALRIGKGFLWAVLLSPYLLIAFNEGLGRRFFSAGLISGLVGVGAFSILERWVFPGLFDFSTDYRTNALFSTMHNGGGHIESYLSLVMPFLALLFLSDKYVVISRIGGMLLLFLSVYALLMTFSRGGAIGIAVSFLVLLAGLYFHYAHKQLKLKQSLAIVSFLLIVVATLAIPVFTGDLMKNRFDVAGQDSASRHHHWAAAIESMDGDIVTQSFGMGLGSFPRTFFWANQEDAHPATYRIGSDKGNSYLALQGGDALFMGQYVDIKPYQQLKLSLDIRATEQNASLSIPICEKSLQYSFRCVSTAIEVKSLQWQHVEKVIDSEYVGALSPDIASGWLSRPVQLALYAGGDANRVIEVDNLMLLDAQGTDLLKNGDFSQGVDFWYPSTEKHNPWHIFNIWVHVLFDMGWLGLCSFILLIMYVYYRLFKSLRHDIYAVILLASFSGFLIIGYVDSPFDAPRLTFLFCMLVIFALFGCKRPHKPFRVI